jgi:hypothetical protein
MARTIPELLEQFAPEIREAFLEAVRDITDQAQIGEMARALERGDLVGAYEALYIERAAFGNFTRAIGTAYNAGGIATIGGFGRLRDSSGARFVVRFDGRNRRAEEWLQSHSSTLVTRIVDEQRDVIREHLRTGMEAGQNPRTVALDVAGRINAATGKREGGVVGLSGPMERYVANARNELISGDLSAYLTRARRDKRFDRTVIKALKAGKAIPADVASKIVNRYSDSLLKLRAETIARTEAMASLHAAQDEATRQLVDSGKVSEGQIIRIWDATADKRTRDDHEEADGQQTGLNGLFTVGGVAMRYPGDPMGGAKNVINCRCHLTVRVDWLAGVE